MAAGGLEGLGDLILSEPRPGGPRGTLAAGGCPAARLCCFLVRAGVAPASAQFVAAPDIASAAVGSGRPSSAPTGAPSERDGASGTVKPLRITAAQAGRGAARSRSVRLPGPRTARFRGVCLILAAVAPALETALALLLARSALSQMDVPVRSSYVMAVVTPPERPAAASVTSVPRSLAAAASPALAGALFEAGLQAWPLVLCGLLKILYDLALLWAFRHVKPPEERARGV